jgi:hypothetical protein
MFVKNTDLPAPLQFAAGDRGARGKKKGGPETGEKFDKESASPYNT